MAARFVIATLIIAPLFFAFLKIFFWGYLPHLILPEKGYQVSIQMMGNSHRNRVKVKSYIPQADFRQEVEDTAYEAGPFEFGLKTGEVNQQANWEAFGQVGKFVVNYSFTAHAKAVRWEIPADLTLPKGSPRELKKYLQATEMMPIQDPALQKKHAQLIGEEENLALVLGRVFDYVAAMETTKFKGSTSALTALALDMASCNGKGHLFAALLRMSGVPTKLVGGLVMETGSKQISHQWVEVWVNGNWVVFDPTNKHFAYIPAHYLKVYEGDEKFFSHSKNIAFNWRFSMESFLSPPRDTFHLKSASFNVLKVYDLFQEAGISLTILKILLMIPVGGLIATFFRNVIGTQTYGTFLPALIAAASFQTGVWWGLGGFFLVIFILALIRALLEKMDLMHTPKLSAMLTIVVILVVGMSMLSTQFTGLGLEKLSLFPIAILTLTTERFSIIVEENSIRKAMFIMGQTLLVTFVCYLFMSNLFLQISFLAFPELSLLVIGINLWLGRWVGLRLTELYRFRSVIFSEKA